VEGRKGGSDKGRGKKKKKGRNRERGGGREGRGGEKKENVCLLTAMGIEPYHALYHWATLLASKSFLSFFFFFFFGGTGV
jgi:hypothetical protein